MALMIPFIAVAVILAPRNPANIIKFVLLINVSAYTITTPYSLFNTVKLAHSSVR